jgi:RHS repeat-associated protein
VRRAGDSLVESARLQFVSDGQGQLLAVGDSVGGYALGSPDGDWGTNGLTARAQTFDAQRWTSTGHGAVLSSFRTRQYDPQTGSWLQEDHAGLAGGVNLYQFNGNDPNSYRDPFGTCPWCIGAGAGAVIGAGGTLIYNYVHDKPLSTNLVRNTLIGAGVGATLGFGWQAIAARAATSAVAAEVTATGTAAAAKTPFEDFPAWGRTAVGWGKDAAGAAKAMAEMTVEKAASLDPAKVQAAKAFYENAVANGKGGVAAPARIELMQRILDLVH